MRAKTENEINTVINERIRNLEDSIDYRKYSEEEYDFFGIKVEPGYYIKDYTLRGIIEDISKRLKKIEEIIGANDYEYKTETKLIKRKNKE